MIEKEGRKKMSGVTKKTVKKEKAISIGLIEIAFNRNRFRSHETLKENLISVRF